MKDSKAWKKFKKNPGALIGLSIVCFFTVLALFPSFFAPHSPEEIFSSHLKEMPLWRGGEGNFIMGTDDLGRDLMSRLIYGARVSMGVGLLVVFFSTFFGLALGLLSGHFGGYVDRIIMRVIDIIMSLPSILLAIVVVAITGPKLSTAILAVSIVALPPIVRVVRSAVINEKAKDYVNSAKCLGAGHMRILFAHILPNCMAPIIVQSTLVFSDGILNVAALGFLGLGAQPPTAEWGTMLSDARLYIESAPWLVTFPGLCILLVVLGFNLMGDGLRDALDPKLKH